MNGVERITANEKKKYDTTCMICKGKPGVYAVTQSNGNIIVKKGKTVYVCEFC